MKNILTKFAFVFAIALLFTACPKPTGDNEITGDSLTEKIAAAQTSIDFEGAEIAEDAVVAKKITVKNLKLGGKTLTIEASGAELQNVSNAVIVIDQKVGNGDVTLTGCSNITKLVVNGGGSNSIHIKNSKVTNVEVKKDAVRVAMEGTSEVEALVVDAAATKIESEENIVIKSIEVAAGVDKVTVKGGTVEKIEVKSSEQSQNAAEVIIDGKTNVQNIEGTTEVTLTEDAVDSNATVVIAANENVIPPTASFKDSTITFTDNGSVAGTSFEDKDYFYEYIFDLAEDNPEISALELQLKIYKLADKILVYAYSSTIIPYTQTKSYCMGGSQTSSIQIEDTYGVTFILKSAGLVLGQFTQDRPECSNITLNKTFDVNNCKMPATLVFPKDPDQPVITVVPTSDGNKITVSNISKGTQRVCVSTGEKNAAGEWVDYKEPLFYIDTEVNTDEASFEFLDKYVKNGNEYIYYCYTNLYSFDSKRYTTVFATGGLGELTLSAEYTPGGIKLTVPYIEEAEDYFLYCTIRRNHSSEEYVRIGNYNSNKINPIIDYFVNPNSKYKYDLENKFVYKNTNITYIPRSNVFTIEAREGLGETIITNSPAATYSNKTINFTENPVLKITSLPEGFKSYINFMYSKGHNIKYDYNSSTSITNFDLWETCNEESPYELINSYNVDITYDNGIQFLYFKSNVSFPAMPQTIVIQ